MLSSSFFKFKNLVVEPNSGWMYYMKTQFIKI